MALINYNDDSYTPGDFPEYTPPAPMRQSGKRGVGVVAVILGLIFLAGLAALFVYGPRYVTSLLNSGKPDSAVVISAGQTATAMVAEQFALAAPTEKVFESEIETEEPVVPADTPVPAEPTSTEPVIVSTNTALPVNTPVPATEITEVVGLTPAETETQLPIEQTPEAEPVETESFPTATETAAQIEPTVDASEFMLTPVETETLQPTETAEVEIEPTQTETALPEPTVTMEATPDPTATSLPEPTATETMVAQTEAAASTPTATVTELPDTGFADDIGLPFLAISSLLLLTTIILSRKKRLS